jgi:hypothetical protein
VALALGADVELEPGQAGGTTASIVVAGESPPRRNGKERR